VLRVDPERLTLWFWLAAALEVLVGLLWLSACLRIHRLAEWHHFWIGLALCAGGLGMTVARSDMLTHYAGIVLYVLGIWISADDAGLHWLQSRDSEYKRLAANFRPGTLGGLDEEYSIWHRLAQKAGLI